MTYNMILILVRMFGKTFLVRYIQCFLECIENDIMNYIREVYLIEDDKFIFDVFLPFSNTVVCNEETAVEYMKLAKTFWEKRTAMRR